MEAAEFYARVKTLANRIGKSDDWGEIYDFAAQIEDLVTEFDNEIVVLPTGQENL